MVEPNPGCRRAEVRCAPGPLRGAGHPRTGLWSDSEFGSRSVVESVSAFAVHCSTMSYMRCEHCGSEFLPRAQKKYCSHRCGWLAWKARQPPPPVFRACKGCGVPFRWTAPAQKFCTKECWKAAYRDRAVVLQREYARRTYQPRTALKPCAQCGEATLRRKFCSERCASAAVAAKYRESHPGRVCPDCGGIYYRPGRSTIRCLPCAERHVLANPPEPRRARYPKLTRTPYVCYLWRKPKVRSFVAGVCPCCGESFVAALLSTRYCSPTCSRRGYRDAGRQIRRKRKSFQTVERVFRQKVFERDDWTCRICNKPVDRAAEVPASLAPTVDHIVPLALGGEHAYRNVQTAHFICNSVKGANIAGQLAFAA